MTYYNITHDSCDDGATSAAIVKKHNPEAVIVPTTYSHTWKKIKFNPGDKVLFTDFSPEPIDAWNLYNQGVEFQVLDHHITAVNKLDEYWKTNPKEANIIRSHTLLDMNRCGATLTWDYLFSKVERPLFLKYIQIADLWRWEEDADAKYVNQYIRVNCPIGNYKSMGMMMDNFNYPEAVEKGKLIHKRMELDIDDFMKKSHYLRIGGEVVYAVNSSHALSISDLGHRLSMESRSPNGVGAIYNLNPHNNYVRFSFRGKKGTSNARELAEKLGGGGHNEASGANVSIEDFIKILETK
jgi:oligoribonuclease NrnB/cAMP/cGMP phosphodiesterase (DHH superfamily)